MKPISLLILFLSFTMTLHADGVKLLGANGVTIEFAGVLKATPKGMVLLMQADGDEMAVDWDRFDLDDLKKRHPHIYAAKTTAESQRADVALRLGVYAGKQSTAEFKKNLKDALSRKVEIKLPKMSDFFDDKDIKDGNFNYNHINDFKFAEKRSARYMKLYTELLERLIGWENPTFKESTHTLIESNGSRNVVITEAEPTRKTAPVAPVDFVRFLAEENNRLGTVTVVLLQYNRALLNALCDTLEEAEVLLTDDAVLADSSTVSNWQYLIRETYEHFNSMKKSKTVDAELDRDLRRMIETFEL